MAVHNSGTERPVLEEERLRFEPLLADISSRFVHILADPVDSEIEGAQRELCRCLGLDIAVLGQLSPDENQVPMEIVNKEREKEFTKQWKEALKEQRHKH